MACDTSDLFLVRENTKLDVAVGSDMVAPGMIGTWEFKGWSKALTPSWHR